MSVTDYGIDDFMDASLPTGTERSLLAGELQYGGTIPASPSDILNPAKTTQTLVDALQNEVDTGEAFIVTGLNSDHPYDGPATEPYGSHSAGMAADVVPTDPAGFFQTLITNPDVGEIGLGSQYQQFMAPYANGDGTFTTPSGQMLFADSGASDHMHLGVFGVTDSAAGTSAPAQNTATLVSSIPDGAGGVINTYSDGSTDTQAANPAAAGTAGYNMVNSAASKTGGVLGWLTGALPALISQIETNILLGGLALALIAGGFAWLAATNGHKIQIQAPSGGSSGGNSSATATAETEAVAA